MTMVLPPAFATRMQQHTGEEYSRYISALSTPPPVSIRTHPLKIKTGLPYEAVAWCPQGYYLPSRPVFTFDPAFQAGAYYVQEAASMFTGWALQQAAQLTQPLKVLDLCAAPGGKSTQLLSLLSPQSLLVANEVIKTRVGVLRENLEKWGYPNVVVTNNDPQDFEALAGFFDVVVCDAPCSGEGLFRKEPEAINEWSEANVQLCSQRQQRILVSAIKTLKTGGHLIYSTCTHAPEENEHNVAWMCRGFGLEEIKLQLPPETGIEESQYGYRFYPHKVKSEGFYLAVLRKTGSEMPATPKTRKQWFTAARKTGEELTRYFSAAVPKAFYEKNGLWQAFPAAHMDTLNILADKLRIVVAGTETGELLRGELLPAQALAHSVVLNPGVFETLELDMHEAVKYLRKDNTTDASGIRGWKIVTYKGLGLGFIKNLGNRTNNYFPKERRILKTPAEGQVTSIV